MPGNMISGNVTDKCHRLITINTRCHRSTYPQASTMSKTANTIPRQTSVQVDVHGNRQHDLTAIEPQLRCK
eukprot:6336262-Pyramimonas_sp.AAC.1